MFLLHEYVNTRGHMWQVSPKYHYTSTTLRVITFQKTILFALLLLLPPPFSRVFIITYLKQTNVPGIRNAAAIL